MKILLFTNISNLGTTLPQKVGQHTYCRLDRFVVCRCILWGLGWTLQHHHNDSGDEDFVRKMDHQKHLGSLGLPNQYLSVPAAGRRARWASGLLQGHFFHTSQNHHPANIQQDFPPSTLIQTAQILFIFPSKLLKQKHIFILFINNIIIFLKGCKNSFTHLADRYARTAWASEVISAPVATPRLIHSKRPPSPVKITSQLISQGHTKSGKELRMKFCPVLYQQISFSGVLHFFSWYYGHSSSYFTDGHLLLQAYTTWSILEIKHKILR